MVNYMYGCMANYMFKMFRLVSSMGRADLLWPRVDLDLTRKVRSNTGRVNVDQRWARLEAGEVAILSTPFDLGRPWPDP